MENDRLRAKAAKVLEKHGCSRVQKSVFVAPRLENRHLDELQADLAKLLEGRPLADQEGILVIPLADELARQTRSFGRNNMLPQLLPPPLKKIL